MGVQLKVMLMALVQDSQEAITWSNGVQVPWCGIRGYFFTDLSNSLWSISHQILIYTLSS